MIEEGYYLLTNIITNADWWQKEGHIYKVSFHYKDKDENIYNFLDIQDNINLIGSFENFIKGLNDKSFQKLTDDDMMIRDLIL